MPISIEYNALFIAGLLLSFNIERALTHDNGLEQLGNIIVSELKCNALALDIDKLLTSTIHLKN